MTALLLTAFLLLQGNVLEWDPPTLGSDGKPLRDLAGFVVYTGQASGHYTHQLDVGLVLYLDMRSISNLERGILYFFAVAAYDTAENLSDLSDEVSNILEDGNTGLPDSEEPGRDFFVIYPNPFDSFVNVDTGGRRGVVQVFNLLGRSVDLIYVDVAGGTLDTSRIPSGVYLFHFEGQTIKGLLLR